MALLVPVSPLASLMHPNIAITVGSDPSLGTRERADVNPLSLLLRPAAAQGGVILQIVRGVAVIIGLTLQISSPEPLLLRTDRQTSFVSCMPTARLVWCAARP